MGTARYIIGDVTTELAKLDDDTIDLVLTSPPFLIVRDYLPADHPLKHLEIGHEANPADFLDTLLALTAEWRRVLAPHGSIAVELGDKYAGSGGAGGDYNDNGLRDGQPKFGSVAGRAGWPLDKSACGIPHLYHLSLAYGVNLLTGQPSPAGQWRVRNVVAWCRPNPPVGALGDKFRPATSYMTIATVARDRYFDLDAVRGPYSEKTNARVAKGVEQIPRSGKSADRDGNWSSLPERDNDGAGAPPLDYWEIPTQPYAGSHYATWPMALCKRPIESMVPQRVCTTCGKPSERITSTEQQDTGRTTNGAKPRDRAESFAGTTYEKRTVAVVETLGWSDCGHDTWRRGIVLDPFAGSGTTLAVATGLGRDAIGIDLDGRNAWLARERIGMFLTIEGELPPEPIFDDIGDGWEGGDGWQMEDTADL